MGDKVVNIMGKVGPDPDVLFCFDVMPPLVIPISEKAKGVVPLPDGCDCAIFIGEDPDKVLSMFGADAVVGQALNHTPLKIAALTIKLLH